MKIEGMKTAVPKWPLRVPAVAEHTPTGQRRLFIDARIITRSPGIMYRSVSLHSGCHHVYLNPMRGLV